MSSLTGRRAFRHGAIALIAIGVVYASSPRIVTLAAAPEALRARTSAAPCADTLYVLARTTSGSYNFHTVDPVTGAATAVSQPTGVSTPTDGLGLRYAADGTLYGRDPASGRRIIVDVDSGSAIDAGPDPHGPDWLPPAYLAEGQTPLGYQAFRGMSRHFAAVDSNEPFARHDIGIPISPALNFMVGDAVEKDGSMVYLATQDAVYAAPPPNGPLSTIFFLGVFSLSTNARVSDLDDERRLVYADGAMLYVLDLDDGSVSPLFSPGLSRIVDVFWRPCPGGGVRITPTSGLTTTEAGGTASFSAVLTKAPLANVTLNLGTSNAVEGLVSPASLTFTPADWSTPQTATVTGVADYTIDGPAQYSVITSNTTSVDPNYVDRFVADIDLTNADDGAIPSITIAATSAIEGQPLLFIASLDAPSRDTVTVQYATSDGTATESDYDATSGTFTFAPGVISQSFSVTTIANTLHEADETLAITLSNAANATIGSTTTIGTIVDDDPQPSMSISSPTVYETEGSVVFTVTLSSPSAVPASANWTTSDGTARAGIDYVASSGIVTFAPGTVTATITVPLIDNSQLASTGTFDVTLSSATGASIAQAVGTALILAAQSIPLLSPWMLALLATSLALIGYSIRR